MIILLPVLYLLIGAVFSGVYAALPFLDLQGDLGELFVIVLLWPFCVLHLVALGSNRLVHKVDRK